MHPHPSQNWVGKCQQQTYSYAFLGPLIKSSPVLPTLIPELATNSVKSSKQLGLQCIFLGFETTAWGFSDPQLAVQVPKPLLRALLRYVLPRDAHVADFCAGAGAAAQFLNDTGLVKAYAFDASTNIKLLSKNVVEPLRTVEVMFGKWKAGGQRI